MNSTVQVPLWIIIGQWMLLFALGFLVFSAYRQLAYILHLKEVLNNMGSEKDGLPTGSQAPVFNYTPTRESGSQPKRFEPQNAGTLLLFADPECFSCQNALTALENLAPQIHNKVQILVMTSSNPDVIAVVDEFNSTSFEVGHIEKEVVFKLYQTNTTPFLYLIDAKGVIQAKGIAGSKNDIKQVLRKVDRNFDHNSLEVVYPVK